MYRKNGDAQMREIFIHIGLHRTGSTFLQEKIFSNIPLSAFVRGHDYICSFMINADIPSDGKIVISYEGLTGHNYLDNSEASPFEMADRIKKLWSDAKIILVLREKDDWRRSLYRQYVNRLSKFMREPILSEQEWTEKIFRKRDFSFDDFVDYLNGLFDEILVLHYEDLRDNPHKFIKDICDFIGVPSPNFSNERINVGLSKRKMRAIRWLSRRSWSSPVKILLSEIIKNV